MTTNEWITCPECGAVFDGEQNRPCACRQSPRQMTEQEIWNYGEYMIEPLRPNRPFAGLVSGLVLVLLFAVCVAAVWVVMRWFGWQPGGMLAVALALSAIVAVWRVPSGPCE